MKFTQLNMTRFARDHGAASRSIELADDEIVGVCFIDKHRNDQGDEAWLAIKSGVRILVAAGEHSAPVHARMVDHMLADKKLTKAEAEARAVAAKKRQDAENAALRATLAKYPQMTGEQITQIPTWLTLDQSHPHHIEQHVDRRRHK